MAGITATPNLDDLTADLHGAVCMPEPHAFFFGKTYFMKDHAPCSTVRVVKLALPSCSLPGPSGLSWHTFAPHIPKPQQTASSQLCRCRWRKAESKAGAEEGGGKGGAAGIQRLPRHAAAGRGHRPEGSGGAHTRAPCAPLCGRCAPPILTGRQAASNGSSAARWATLRVVQPGLCVLIAQEDQFCLWSSTLGERPQAGRRANVCAVCRDCACSTACIWSLCRQACQGAGNFCPCAESPAPPAGPHPLRLLAHG